MRTPVPPTDTDLLIIGGGPAGCAAAVMAASVGMRSLIVEAAVLCRKLHHIGAVNNVLGGFATGPGLADAIIADVHRSPLCRVELGQPVTSVHAGHGQVEARLASGRRVTARHAVVATGVRPLQPADAEWISSPSGLTLPPLWKADPAADLSGRTVLVLGADRPLGTFLRAHPHLDVRFVVAHPPGDTYKADEVRPDPRVQLMSVHHLTLRTAGDTSGGTVTAACTGTDGASRTHTAEAAFTNIGSAPAPPGGDLATAPGGYCPPARQHPRILVAGDLRSPRHQRIMTAIGSGGEAALTAYYAAQGLPT